MGKRARGICVYCGREKKLTSDHVFPKSLFIKKDPEMLTVPVCNDCNQLKSSGDADLEVFANLDIYGSNHPDSLQHIKRISERNESTSEWLYKTIHSAREVPIQTESGVIVGSSLQVSDYNFERIIRSLNMAVRGLYFHSRSEALPLHIPTYVFRMPWNMSLQTLALLGPHKKSEPIIKGNNVVFWGELNAESDNPYDTLWVICIYDAIVFLAATGERWSGFFRDFTARLEDNAKGRPAKEYEVLRPAPDGEYRLPLL